MLANPGGAAAQHAFGVDGRGKHFVAGMFGDRQALAGQHRLVDAGGAFENFSIDGYAFTRPDDKDIAGNQLCGIDFDDATIALDARRFWLQTRQRFDGGRRARLGSLPSKTSVMTEADASKYTGRS